MSKVLSLDISASSTGWCIWPAENLFEFGVIKTSPKFNRSERLFTFSTELELLLLKHQPEFIVLEDTFAKINISTLKMLVEFGGVAKMTCQRTLGIDPYVISNNTVKAYFKVKKKEELFVFVTGLLDNSGLTFKKDNDIIDSVGMLMCYLDLVLKIKTFRTQTEFGFTYNLGV